MPKNTTICGLILVAGLSSRMGDFKPLLPLCGKTLIENTVDSMLRGGAEKIVVVTGYRGNEVEDILRNGYAEQVIFARNPDYETTDMMHSIQFGCRAMPECDAFFLLPGDMPAVRQDTFMRMENAYSGEQSIIFPTLDGWRKHPPLIDARFIPAICSFCEEGGLRQFWKYHKDSIREVPVDDIGVWVDLDTPKDYQSCKNQYEKL